MLTLADILEGVGKGGPRVAALADAAVQEMRIDSREVARGMSLLPSKVSAWMGMPLLGTRWGVGQLRH